MKSQHHLEERITEAVDGQLNSDQLASLEADLRAYPDLLAEYQFQMKGSPVSLAYESVQPSPFAVSKMRTRLRNLQETQWQFDALRIFRRYVIAAGLGAILMVAALHALPSTTSQSDTVTDEVGLLFDTIEQDALSWSIPDNSQSAEEQK